MNRRTYLSTLLAAGALGGCVGFGGDGTQTDDSGATDTNTDGADDPADGPGPSGTDRSTDPGNPDGPPSTGGPGSGTATATPAGPGNYDLPISRGDLRRGAPKDRIPAIVDPAFGPDWGPMDGLSLEAGDEVIGVERDGEARAYPLRILDWHEVVNDDFNGPLLVTYCPLCGSGVTADRLVRGTETRFGVSGLLWQSDLVMYDELTESLWSQLLGTAINGPQTGETLPFVPSSLTTWGEWQDSHPATEVLLPPPESGTIVDSGLRDYGREAYVGYDESERIGIGYNDFDDDRLHPKASVIGVTHDGEARAYPLTNLGEDATVMDSVGDLPVVVATTGDGSLFAYERRVDGEVLDFENEGARHFSGGGSRWEKVSGRAVDGPHDGTTLTRANDRSQMFWFAWADFFPETTVYTG